MEWLSHTPVQPGPLVSVIVPTRDRLPFLKRAIASLENQTYGLWEALIVNDGSTDETSAFLHSLQKPRFRSFESGARGPCAARNVGLQHATGQLIAYLDDDNIMHPNWLKSVVWAFQQRPEIDVLYGAFIIDDMRRIDSVGRGDLPSLFFLPYDPQGILEGNVADISCIAHRGGLSEAHFDESLREMGDWDLFIRLTREKPPLALPVVACFYTTEAPNRLTLGPTHQADFEKVKMKNRR
jgi:glycosyltransferase involved in cell wall biosynthesis